MLLLLSLVLAGTLTTTFAQSRYQPYPEKQGSCPPSLPVQICSRSCFSDFHCQENAKCCPTTCGGYICSRPVTMRNPTQEKPGSCPTVPTGRWVCSSTCNSDNDCRGNMKCCKNRCGALACQKPEVTEAPNFPFVPLPGYDSNIPESPYGTADDSNSNPYYAYNNK